VSYGTWIALGVAVASLAVSIAAFVRAGRWRAQERREAVPDLEIIVHRRFALDYKNLSARFERAEVIAQNKSSVDVTVTRIGVRSLDYDAPAKLVGEELPETIDRGKALHRVIRPLDFADLLGLIPPSYVPDEPRFLVYAESRYGSTMKHWASEPFTLVSSRQQLTGEYDSWTE
jgi:hypothetical protein